MSSGVISSDGQIEQGIDVADRRDQHVPLEYGSVVQERDQLVGTGHHRRLSISPRDDLAERRRHRTKVRGLA